MSAAAPGALLEVERVGFSYAGRQALEDVSLRLEAGQVMALLGPNGAGKSSLVRCLCGQLRPHTGSVRVLGRCPLTDAGTRERIGIVPQAVALFPRLTAGENLRAFARLAGLTRAETEHQVGATLARVGLSARRDEPLEALSGGMQRLLNLAAALLHRPRLLLLDEPTTGIDQRSRERFRRLLGALRAEGLGILLTTHELEDAEALADRVLVLSDGRVRASGAVHALVERAFGGQRELQVVLGVEQAPSTEHAALRGLLGTLGLAPDAQGAAWSGLVDPAAPACAELLRSCNDAGQAIAELRLRKPGLARLLAHYTRR